jgi:hypothetical protein
MNKRTKLIVAVVIAAVLFAAVVWADANGYHYPCVRCNPFGVIVP